MTAFRSQSGIRYTNQFVLCRAFSRAGKDRQTVHRDETTLYAKTLPLRSSAVKPSC